MAITSITTTRGAPNATQLYPLLARVIRARVMLFYFHGDEFDPGGRGERSRDILAKRHLDYVVIDQPRQLATHWAAGTPLFAQLYGGCILAFLEASQFAPDAQCNGGTYWAAAPTPSRHADTRIGASLGARQERTARVRSRPWFRGLPTGAGARAVDFARRVVLRAAIAGHVGRGRRRTRRCVAGERERCGLLRRRRIGAVIIVHLLDDLRLCRGKRDRGLRSGGIDNELIMFGADAVLVRVGSADAKGGKRERKCCETDK
jgi:hypothetical protein